MHPPLSDTGTSRGGEGTQKTVQLLGGETHYWEYGSREAATTIVCVHGFRGDHHGMEPLVAHLGSYHVVVPDLPGFGSSARFTKGKHDIDGYARWLSEFVDVIAAQSIGGPETLVLLGHSFGSILAAAAVEKGLRIGALVLINPIAAPALSGPRGVLTRLAVMYYSLAAALPERIGFALLRNKIIVRVMSSVMAKTRNRTLRRFIHDQHDRYFTVFSDRDVVLEAFTASVTSNVSEFAARIPQRTLLIAAEKDDITPLAAQKRLQTLFPRADVHVIPKTGHLIHYETPEDAAHAVHAFLQRGTS